MNGTAATTIAGEPTEWSLPSRGRAGMISLIVTETALFSIFVVAYLFYIGKSLNGPYPKDVLDLPILATVCLLSSSITITLAERGLKRGHIGSFNVWWLLTIVLGATFLVETAMEWNRLIFEDGLTIATNLFGTTFYSLVGFHAAHVTVGLILLTLTLVLSVLGYVKQAHGERIEVLSWYWHFVDVVWVVVFTVVYIIGR